MNVVCSFCQTSVWREEHVLAQRVRDFCSEDCCKKGDVRIDNLVPPPPFLNHVLRSTDDGAGAFRQHIRQYNSAPAVTLIQYQPDLRSRA